MNFEESVWLLREIQKNGVGFVPQKMRNFEVSQTDSTSIGIKMLEPADTVIEGQTIVPIVGVKVLMRTDRYPENPFDGDVVLNNTEIGKYEEEPFIVPDLVQGTTYYFTAYPYSVNDVYDLTNSTEDRAELELAFDERVTIASVVDEPTLFPYANIVVHDITDGTEQTKHVDANSSVEFIVPIYHEYYVSSDPVVDFSYPADTEHFNAVGNGVNNLTFEYLYAKNVIDVNVSADSDTGFFSTLEVEVTAHNVTDGTDYAITRIGGGNYRFPAENSKEYYISYGIVPGYGSPDDSERFTIVKDVVKSITAQYVYDVETINVTVTCEDDLEGNPGSALGQVITLHNITDGTTESKTWAGTTLTFFVRSSKQYYLDGDEKDSYIAPSSDIHTASVGVVRDIVLKYDLIRNLEDCSWEQIDKISRSGKASKIFNIGDTKIVHLNDGASQLTFEIVGFDCDILASDETKKAGISFLMRDLVSGVLKYENVFPTLVNNLKNNGYDYNSIKQPIYLFKDIPFFTFLANSGNDQFHSFAFYKFSNIRKILYSGYGSPTIINSSLSTWTDTRVKMGSNETIYSILPDDLKKYIKPVVKICASRYRKYNSDDETIYDRSNDYNAKTTDPIWVPSIFDTYKNGVTNGSFAGMGCLSPYIDNNKVTYPNYFINKESLLYIDNDRFKYLNGSSPDPTFTPSINAMKDQAEKGYAIQSVSDYYRESDGYTELRITRIDYYNEPQYNYIYPEQTGQSTTQKKRNTTSLRFGFCI